MKRLSISILIMLVALNSIMFSIEIYRQPFGGGTGTATDPYKINSREHLKELSDSIKIYEKLGINRTENKFYMLTEDIDSVDFVIGFQELESKMHSFMGYFNGNSKTITLNFDSSNTFQWLALFSYSTGVIDNLKIDGNIKAATNNVAVAGLVCFNAGVVARCTNNATIKGLRNAAGIAFQNFGVITHCVNNGDISAFPDPTKTTTAE